MEIIKIVSVGIICAVLVVIVRQYRPDISPILQIAGIIIVSALALVYLKDIFTSVNELFSSVKVIDSGYLVLLIKILGIAIITKIGSDICNDSGNSALGTNVELAGKILILTMCMSLLKTIAALASGLLG